MKIFKKIVVILGVLSPLMAFGDCCRAKYGHTKSNVATCDNQIIKIKKDNTYILKSGNGNVQKITDINNDSCAKCGCPMKDLLGSFTHVCDSSLWPSDTVPTE